MRIAIVRTDIQKIYLSDIENTSQRDFSSQPKGQSRYFSRPSDAQLAAALGSSAPVTVLGSSTETFDTTVANGTKLNIKTSSTAAFTQVTVRSGAAVTAAQIVTDLNLAFRNAGLALVARADSGAVAIDTVAGGPSAYVNISASSPSTAALQTVLGLATGAVSGLSVASLKTAIYPTAVTVDVSSATILALGTFSDLSTAQQTALVDAIQDLVAPRLVETSMVLRSFSYGVIAELASSAFQPGGSRSGLPAGVAAAVVADDGSTPFTL